MSRRPDFLIVGAPKCGTTAMARYLSAHPDVFVADRKDLHYFGSDLGFTRRDRLNEAAYLEHFDDARAEARVGEASVWYLYSCRAAVEVAQFDPQMRIIVMLRHPVEMMYALYTQLRYNGLGDEDLDTFAAALDAEPSRREGRGLPIGGTPLPEALQYRRTAAFADQLTRYLEVFERQQVCVVLQDDLKADAGAAYRRVLTFLEVDPSFEPDLQVVNAHKVVRSEGLRKLISATPSAAKGLVPHGIRRQVRRGIRRANSRHVARAPLDTSLRTSLVTEFRPQVEQLATLIERDLSAWME